MLYIVGMEENKIPCQQFDPRCSKRSARVYRRINIGLAILLVLLCVAGVIVPSFSDEQFSVQLISVLVFFLFFIVVHAWRAIWLCNALKKKLKIVGDASAFELERIALLAWVGVAIMTLYRCIANVEEDLSLFGEISDWLISLLLLSPIVTLVGPGWGKLYVESPNGKIYWPMCLKACNKSNCDIEKQ